MVDPAAVVDPAAIIGICIVELLLFCGTAISIWLEYGAAHRAAARRGAHKRAKRARRVHKRRGQRRGRPINIDGRVGEQCSWQRRHVVGQVGRLTERFGWLPGRATPYRTRPLAFVPQIEEPLAKGPQPLSRDDLQPPAGTTCAVLTQ